MSSAITKIKRKLVRRIAKMRIKGALQTELIPCPVCGNTDNFTTLHTTDRYDLPVTTVACPKCSFVFSNPAPTDAFQNIFYSTTMFRGLDWGVMYPNARVLKEFNAKERALRHLLFFKETIFPKTKNTYHSILDIGSSDGTFLLAVKEAYTELHPYSVEPDKQFRHNTEGVFEAMYDSIDDVPEGMQFDIITLWHVLEHVRNPIDFLKKIFTHVSQDGRFVFEVPDFDRYDNSMRPYHIDHVNHFSEKTLRELLGQAGFVLEEVTRDSKYVMDQVYGIKVVAKKGV